MTIRFASERDIAHPEEGKEDVRNVPHDKRPENSPCYCVPLLHGESRNVHEIHCT